MVPVIPKQLREFPLIRVERGRKSPRTSPEAVEPVGKIEEWVESGGNYGVRATAANGLVVLDVDTRRLAGVVATELPPTFTVRTGGDGVGSHAYYMCHEWQENRQLREDDDDLGSLRADGWYAVGPGSIHPSGGRYEVVNDVPLVTVEREELVGLLDAFGADHGSGWEADAERERGRSDLDELDRLVDHDRYRAEVRDVLEDRGAPHERRVWLAGFLLDAVGLSVGETVKIISKFNRWDNFDREITREQVASVARSTGGGR